MSALPPWPTVAPAWGGVRLRAFTDDDVDAAVALGHDPYVPLIGSLPADPTPDEALAWIERQRGRHAEGAGFSFAVADARTDRCLGAIGVWLKRIDAGRATLGYAVVPAERGRGVASDAVRAALAFAWTLPGLCVVELHVEPWNAGSRRVAEKAGFARHALLPAHQEIGGRRRDMIRYVLRRP